MSAAPVAISRDLSVRHHLAFANDWLADDEITEIAVNRPGEVWVERNNVWEKHVVDSLTYTHCASLATAIAKFCSTDITDTSPLMDAILHNGERVKVIMPPACEQGTISLTIRKPSHQVRDLKSYADQGFFKHIKPISTTLSADDQELLSLKADGNYQRFFSRAVAMGKVLVVAGETGSGKTTFMKGLMQSIPASQRVITIEDTPELFLPNHPNHVHLYYPSEASQDNNDILTSAALLKTTLRMKPDRILLAELRGAETFDWVNIVLSGHGGSITSLHAGSTAQAFDRLALMVLQNRQGRTLPYEVIRHLLSLAIDIVVHMTHDTEIGLGRHITEIYYEPSKHKTGVVQ